MGLWEVRSSGRAALRLWRSVGLGCCRVRSCWASCYTLSLILLGLYNKKIFTEIFAKPRAIAYPTRGLDPPLIDRVLES